MGWLYQIGSICHYALGGEAQRVKLATQLSRRSNGRTLYILDEPTTGLHTADIHCLLQVLNRLVEAGDTVVIIEHNLDVIKTADYIIDLGPKAEKQEARLLCVVRRKSLLLMKRAILDNFLEKFWQRARGRL